MFMWAFSFPILDIKTIKTKLLLKCWRLFFQAILTSTKMYEYLHSISEEGSVSVFEETSAPLPNDQQSQLMRFLGSEY